MSDDQIGAELLLLAARLADKRLCVTSDLLTDQHGYADIMGKSPKTILNWHYQLIGPAPASIVRGRKLWRIADIVAYRDNPGGSESAA